MGHHRAGHRERRGDRPHPRAGTASRRGSQVRPTESGSRPARAQSLAEAQTQVDLATFIQWVDAYALERAELADFYYRCFGVSSGRPSRPGSLRDRSRTRTLPEPVRPARVPTGGSGRGRATRRGRRVFGSERPRHPATVELRPRRRPLRGCALRRGDQHEAPESRTARRAPCIRLRGLRGHGRLDRDLPYQRRRLNTPRTSGGGGGHCARSASQP